MTISRLCLLLAVILLAAACAPQPTTISANLTPEFSADQRATQIAASPELQDGARVYTLYCGHCHGHDGEGQHPDTVQNTINLGLHTVPPHDVTGHTWQHPDPVLAKVIREGVVNPVQHYPMGRFGELLTNAEIQHVIDYMKLWWTAEQRAHNARVTADYLALNAELGITEEPG
jgi:mono/diheme cytochrome c family protein